MIHNTLHYTNHTFKNIHTYINISWMDGLWAHHYLHSTFHNNACSCMHTFYIVTSSHELHHQVLYRIVSMYGWSYLRKNGLKSTNWYRRKGRKWSCHKFFHQRPMKCLLATIFVISYTKHDLLDPPFLKHTYNIVYSCTDSFPNFFSFFLCIFYIILG